MGEYTITKKTKKTKKVAVKKQDKQIRIIFDLQKDLVFNFDSEMYDLFVEALELQTVLPIVNKESGQKIAINFRLVRAIEVV